jgi:hypothetical protein
VAFSDEQLISIHEWLTCLQMILFPPPRRMRRAPMRRSRIAFARARSMRSSDKNT